MMRKVKNKNISDFHIFEIKGEWGGMSSGSHGAMGGVGGRVGRIECGLELK